MVKKITDLNNYKNFDNKKNNQIDSMAFLKQKLNEIGMPQKELAQKLKRNVVTVTRWVNGSREISAENAIKIGTILNCDPAEILFPEKKLKTIEVHSYTDLSFMVKDLTKKYYKNVMVPDGYYTPATKAVKFFKIGNQHHEEIFLFERYGTKNNYEGFHEDSIGKICYLEPITKKVKQGCTPIMALVKINETTSNYSLDILNPKTEKPFNEMSIGVNPDWIKVCAPKKCSFFERYNHNFISKNLHQNNSH